MTTSKYQIVLKNIDILAIDKKYTCDTTTTSTTNITDLNIFGNMTYVDELKNSHMCMVSMIDFVTKKDISEVKYNCYWCRHSFDTVPIGCPIRYIPTQAEKNYYSFINQDKYTIKESITKSRVSDIETNFEVVHKDKPTPENHILVKPNDVYETDGVFCSFNCCKAWIIDNRPNPMYQQSMMLLSRIFSTIYQTKNINITEAPHWRTLKNYGGDLPIIKFRDSFYKIEYKSRGIVSRVPKFISVGTLYEEKIKIST